MGSETEHWQGEAGGVARQQVLETAADRAAGQAMRMQPEGGAREHKIEHAEQPPHALVSALGSGERLPQSERAFFEPRFGHDFSRVRIHRDGAAAESARAEHARAYTAGRDVVFAAGQYAPSTEAGRQLLAHELAHTIQQAGGPAFIQRDDEPPAPARTSSKTVPFGDLQDGEIVSDPTGGAHGIRIERRGDELHYHLPGGETRQVPRPTEKGKTQTIESVTWGLPQGAFSVNYTGSMFDPFSVNEFGLGRHQDLFETLLRMPAALETLPGGLELERKPGILPSGRPAHLEKATRYHMPGASYSLYVTKERNVELVDDGSGKTLSTYTDLVDLQVTPAGDVLLAWDDDPRVMTVQFTLRGSAPSRRGLGEVAEPASRTALLSELRALGVKIEEKGSRFSDDELTAARDLLNGWKGATPVVEALKALKVPGLTLRKDLLVTSASYSPKTGVVKIPGEVVASAESQRSAVIHELTHALFHAAGWDVPETGVPAHVVERAKDIHEDSDLDLIKEGYSGAFGNRKRTVEQWQAVLSTDAEVNRIWQDLHFRFKIGDPEGTGDIRGIDVADESRYGGDPRGDPVGHGYDAVTEFIASFVSSCRLHEAKMVDTVRASGSWNLADQYRRLWHRVDSTLVDLGSTNPFAGP